MTLGATAPRKTAPKLTQNYPSGPYPKNSTSEPKLGQKITKLAAVDEIILFFCIHHLENTQVTQTHYFQGD